MLKEELDVCVCVCVCVGGGFVCEEEHLDVFTYITKAKWNGGERGL